jgi:replicative DNA helicase
MLRYNGYVKWENTKLDFDADKIEFYIIQNLLRSDVYIRTFAGKLNPNLFSVNTQKVVQAIIAYYRRYMKAPPAQVLADKGLAQVCRDDKEEKKAQDTLDAALSINIDEAEIHDWVYDETKKFIKTRTIMNAIIQCVEKIESHQHEEVVSIMENAFKVNFDDSLGLDYFEDLEERMARCEISIEKFSTGLPTLDEYTGGGYRRKSLFVYAGPANTGKTLCLNDAASTLALQGYNVLYLTLELGEDYITQRTDAKFADVPITEINIRPQDAIKKAIAKRDILKKKDKLGKLIYKEYAPNEISSNDIRALLKNLEMKKDFKPDFIIVDYLKLVRPNGKVFSDNAYGKIVTVCEELRALSFEFDACVLTASQTGRQSYGQKTIGMEDISDSIGIAQTADVLITLARPKEMEEDNEMLITIAKSRFSKNGGCFPVKVDYNYMRLVDISNGSQFVNHMNNRDDSNEKIDTKFGKKNTGKKSSKENVNNVEESENTKELDL